MSQEAYELETLTHVITLRDQSRALVSNCFIDVYQTWLISNLITILPDLVPFLIRVNKFMEINPLWVISNCFYRCLPDLVDF